MTTYGYIRTSRQRIQGTAGSDPEAQAHQLRQEGVPGDNIYRFNKPLSPPFTNYSVANILPS